MSYATKKSISFFPVTYSEVTILRSHRCQNLKTVVEKKDIKRNWYGNMWDQK
jgi:hypothetical protein